MAITTSLLSYSMPFPEKVPSLQLQAFKTALPLLDLEVNSIVDRNESLADKLKSLNNVMNRGHLVSHFVLYHHKTQEALNLFVKNFCIKNRDLTLPNAAADLPNLQEALYAKVSGLLLTDHFAKLPRLALANSASDIYTVCLFNDRIALTPLHKILSVICPFLPEQNIVTSLNNDFRNTITVVQQSIKNRISQKVAECNNEKVVHYPMISNIWEFYSPITINVIAHQAEEPTLTEQPITIKQKVLPNSKRLLLSDTGQRTPYVNRFNAYISPNKKMIGVLDHNVIMMHNTTVPTQPFLPFSTTEAIKMGCFSSLNNYFFATEADNSVSRFNLSNNHCYRYEPPHHSDSIKGLCSIENDEALVVTTPQNVSSFSLYSYNLKGEKLLLYKKILCNPMVISDACFSQDGSQLALGCRNGIIIVCDVSTGLVIKTLQSYYSGEITKIVWSSDSSFIVTTIDNCVVSLFHLPSGYCVKNFCLDILKQFHASCHHTITISQEYIKHTESNDALPICFRDTALISCNEKETESLSYSLPIVLLNFTNVENNEYIQALIEEDSWHSFYKENDIFQQNRIKRLLLTNKKKILINKEKQKTIKHRIKQLENELKQLQKQQPSHLCDLHLKTAQYSLEILQAEQELKKIQLKSLKKQKKI